MAQEEATVLSGDLRGHIDPDVLASLVKTAGGTLASFVGNTMTAVWTGPWHRAAACAGILRLDAPDLRAALDSGPITTSRSFLGLGARGLTGEPVVRAGRMLGAARLFGVRIVVSAAVLVEARGKVPARFLADVRLLGSPEAIPVFELVPPDSPMSPGGRPLARYLEGVAAFRSQDFSGALKAFKDVLALTPDDPPSRLYAAASEDYAAAPPPDGWDGVFNLTS